MVFRQPEYACFSDVRNFLTGMTTVDWLSRYGAGRGYAPSGDSRSSSFSKFIMGCGVKFESWVVERVVQPAINALHAGDLSWAPLDKYTRFQQKQHHEATIDALQSRDTLVMYQPFVVDTTSNGHWFGHPDLVVRRDVLPYLESALSSVSNSNPQPLFKTELWRPLGPHERHPGWAVIDIKYSSTLTNKPLYQAQLLVYMQCLNCMTTEHRLPIHEDDLVSTVDLYLLGREGTIQTAFTRNNQVGLVESSLRNARDWLRNVDMTEASEWQLVPTPSVRELLVSSTRDESSVWDDVLNKIAEEQGDVCSVYRLGPAARAKLAFPPLPWFNPLCTARYLGVRADDQAWVDQMLVAARKVKLGEPVDTPAQLTWVQATGAPRAVRHVVIAIDFEFIYDLHRVETFKTSTSAWTFSIAAGVVSAEQNSRMGKLEMHPSEWVDVVSTSTGELTDEGEKQLFERWLTWMKAQQVNNSTVYAVHWSQAEPQALKRLRAKCTPGTPLSDLFVWWDRCVVLIDAMSVLNTRRVIIPGAMEYGLKKVYASLYQRSVAPPPVVAESTTTKSKSKRRKAVVEQQSTSSASTPTSSVLAGDEAAAVAYGCAANKQFINPSYPRNAARSLVQPR